MHDPTFNDVALAVFNRFNPLHFRKITSWPGYYVSTVFIPDEWLWGSAHKYETMAFPTKVGSKWKDYKRTYKTKEEAIIGHHAIVREIMREERKLARSSGTHG